MKHINYEYYCEKQEKSIGPGFCCFDCKLFERSTTPDKKCVHERVTREFVTED